MKKLLQDLDLHYLGAVFLASMLGSVSLTTLLQFSTEPGAPLTLEARIALTLAGLVLYAVVVWLTFYVMVPDARPALRRIIVRKDDGPGDHNDQDNGGGDR